MNTKKIDRLKYLINKVLVDKKSLDSAEAKELKGLLKELEAQREKKQEEKGKFSEVIEDSIMINLGEGALKQSETNNFNKLSLKEKAKTLTESFNKLEQSKYFQTLDKEKKEKDEKEEFDAFYEEHAKKFGNDLGLNFSESDLEAGSEMSEEDKKFYEDYAKQFPI